MKFSHFFIDRPIFAMVNSIVIMLVGGIAYFGLPAAQYPEIVPPTIVVTAQYPGANAQAVAETVATPLEQQINGVENMLYMSSQSTGDGRITLTITFKAGTDVQAAQVLVQNRVAIALPALPDQVRALGVVTDKAAPDLLMVVQVYSPKHTRNQLYLSNYVLTKIQDRIARLDGVGTALIFGARDFSMRVWLDPDRIAALNLTPGDVVAAIRAENVQVAGGGLGEQPMPMAGAFETKLNLKGRLRSPEEFENIIVKAGADGRLTRLKDVARVELGALDYSTGAMRGDDEAASLRITQRPGSNAIATEKLVMATMEDLAKDFPDDVTYGITFNPTKFIEETITELNSTIFIAALLVVIVILFFLQNWRAALIPIASMPVSLIGTFAAMAGLGFSINNLTLFGLVLATGIVVDDAIVVVEAVERNLHNGLSPRDAARQTMDEVGTAVISIAIVLVAVFVPSAFLGGITGAFYRQFAITIAVATIISAFNSLTLSPALCAMLLRPHGSEQLSSRESVRRVQERLERFSARFNDTFDRLSNWYGNFVGKNLRRTKLMLGIYAALLVAAGVLFWKTPQGFIPPIDSGYVIIGIQLPEGASFARTREITDQAQKIVRGTPGVEDAIVFVGLSSTARVNNSNSASIFAPFAPFSKRTSAKLSQRAIMAELRKRLVGLDAQIIVIPPPTVRGLGSAGGFQLYVQDRAGRGPEALAAATQALVRRAAQTPGIGSAFSGFQANNPQLFIDVDRTRARMLQVPLSNVFETFQMYAGGYYVNDFVLLGRNYRVMVQADAPFRADRSEIGQYRTRSSTGAMVPLGSLVTVKEMLGPTRQPHFNMFPAAEMNGEAAPGYSSGEALDIMEKLARETLPEGFSFEWTDMAFQQKLAAGSPLMVFGLAVLFVFLALSAQYESWSLPLAVILIVPMCLLSAIAGVLLRGMDNNILTQVGFVVLIGLAAKNAILIVEFARQQEEAGADRVAAAIEACRLRLRPILMTSFSFIFGVTPLVTATGAASEMRQALGTSVFFGMLGVTVFGLVFTPVFYVVIRALVAQSKETKAGQMQHQPAE